MLNLATTFLILSLVLVFSFGTKAEDRAQAGSQIRQLITHRGIELEVEVTQPTNQQKSPILILAPGQSCEARTVILDAIADRARAENFAVIRFQWVYCKTSGVSLPSPFLVDEIEDLETVLSFMKMEPAFDRDHIVLAGKTQGSFVSYRVFTRQPSVRALALITPVCTYTVDNANQPLPAPIMVGYENYPYLAVQRRPILMLAGSNDKSCLLPALDQLLQATSPNVEKAIVEGDHAFRILDASGEVDDVKTSKNIEAAVEAATTWLTRVGRIGTSLRE